MRFLLLPFSFIFFILTQIRNWAYNVGLLKIHKMNLPIVSVGNLTVGGTGKTPVVDLIAQWADAHCLSYAILSRGYRRRTEGVLLVHPNEEGAAFCYGDEPTLLAKRHPNALVIIGKDKVEACTRAKQLIAQQLISQESLVKRSTTQLSEFCLVDDGFQHRRLHRDLDIVVIDATQVLKNDHYLLPFGRARESYRALRRADVIFLTKVNLVDPITEGRIHDQLRKTMIQCGKSEVPLFRFESRLYELHNLAHTSTMTLNELKGQRVVLVSGIGQPQGFEDLVKKETLADVVGHLRFADHHQFDQGDFKKILKFSLKHCADLIILTEKDSVKFVNWPGNPDQLWIASLEIRSIEPLDPFYALISSKICKKS